MQLIVLSNCEKHYRAPTFGKIYKKNLRRGSGVTATVNYRKFDIWQKVTYDLPTTKMGRSSEKGLRATKSFSKIWHLAEGLVISRLRRTTVTKGRQ